MTENQQPEQENNIQIDTEKRLQHFTAGVIRWLIDKAGSHDWENDFAGHCQNMLVETNNLGNLPSETSKKSMATLKAVPAAILYWLGIYTGFFWIIPGAAIGLAGSYLISSSIYEVFKAGKDSRFYSTFLHYLLRMENADGVISEAELASLRSIIEFIPAPAEEKKRWLTAIESPEGYNELVPNLDLSDKEKESILSGCWGLAICDGSDDSERKIFELFGSELSISDEQLKNIQKNVEARIAQHSYLVDETLKAALKLHAPLAENRKRAAEVLSFVSLKPVSLADWHKRIEKLLLADQLEIDLSAENEFASTILAAGLLLARYLSNTELATTMINEKFAEYCSEASLETRLNPVSEELNQTLSAI